MQACNPSILLSSTLFFAVMAHAQGTFRNLDFELAQVPTSTPPSTLVPASEALPLWTAYVGNNQQSTVLYNNLYLGQAVVALLSSDPRNPFPNGVIQGNYTAVLEAGAGGDAAISQTGTIPPGTKSILFEANMPAASGWTISVGGVTIPVVQVSQVNSYFSLYGGDISAFAGRTEELRFTALLGQGTPDNMFLDAIQFSSSPIPEPSETAMIAFGGLLFILIRVAGSLTGSNAIHGWMKANR